jgi:multidrug resistance efflux pump
MSKSTLRLIPWALGVGVVVTTAAGANYLLQAPTASAQSSAAASAKAPPATATDGLVAKGTVHSDPEVVAYTLPAHLQAGTIAEVPVRNGAMVKVGDVLVRFNTDLLQKDYDKARLAYTTAFHEWERAKVEMLKVANGKAKAKLSVDDARQKRERAKEAVAAAKSALETVTSVSKNADGSPWTQAQIDKYIREDRRMLEANSQVDAAETAITLADLAMKDVENESASLDAKAKVAAANASTMEADAAKAQQAIDDCTVRAKTAGVIEQVTAAVGQTVYPQTRPPLMYLVPTGQRVVWAEVVPEFAYKIKNREGQKVTVTDDSNPNLTYDAVVKRIGSAFLQKPNGTPEAINGKSNLVLNIEVEITDATPANKPPLRVGQPVRVVFP